MMRYTLELRERNNKNNSRTNSSSNNNNNKHPSFYTCLSSFVIYLQKNGWIFIWYQLLFWTIPCCIWRNINFPSLFLYVFSILLLSLSSQSISIVYKNTKPFPEKWVFSVLKVCFILFLIIKKIFIHKYFWPYSCSPSSLSKYLLNPYPKF